VGIGDELLTYDRLGMIAAREIEKLHLPDVKVFFAGTMPENAVGSIREFHPDHVLMIDAADMGAPPGSYDIIEPGKIRARLFSTHALPLSSVMEFIAEDLKTVVTLVGIQPENTIKCDDLSDREKAGMSRLLIIIKSILGETPKGL
jgi:hydrogenase 3 maturation protease